MAARYQDGIIVSFEDKAELLEYKLCIHLLSLLKYLLFMTKNVVLLQYTEQTEPFSFERLGN